jgi:hypothetical protein
MAGQETETNQKIDYLAEAEKTLNAAYVMDTDRAIAVQAEAMLGILQQLTRIADILENRHG